MNQTVGFLLLAVVAVLCFALGILEMMEDFMDALPDQFSWAGPFIVLLILISFAMITITKRGSVAFGVILLAYMMTNLVDDAALITFFAIMGAIGATTAKHTQHLSLIHISEPTRPY